MIKNAALGTAVAAGALMSAGLPAGQTASAAYAPPAELRVTGDHAHSFRIAWDRVAGASGYLVQVNNGSGAIIRSFLTRRDRANVRHLHAARWYTVLVRADTRGSGTAWIRFRTFSRGRVHARLRAWVRPMSPVQAGAEPSAGGRTRSLGQRIAAYARTFPGHASYVWGGTGPHGFDCSGLALYVYRHFGYQLPRTAQEQFMGVRHVQRSSAKPGDLVFFLSGGYAYHVGIYEGGDTMVAAATPASGVLYEQIYHSEVAFGTTTH